MSLSMCLGQLTGKQEQKLLERCITIVFYTDLIDGLKSVYENTTYTPCRPSNWRCKL